jgi:preprotein translocase SecE subunit
MATAVEPSSTPSTPSKALSLPVASLLGAIYVLAALAVAFFAVPVLWKDFIITGQETSVTLGLRISIQAIALCGLVWFGTKMAGETAPKGLRGGVFLMVVALILIFLIARTFAVNIDPPAGNIVGLGVLIGLLFFAGRFFTGKTGERWMVALEEQGWFSFAQYKRSLGVRVRRLTILGILLVLGTGLYAFTIQQGLVPDTLMMTVPFFAAPVTIMTDAKLMVPLILSVLALWIAFRAVNVPDFAEFLIATEAEMNKVSWSSRKRLAQDTVVVLVTTLIMTLFLLVVDLFWGWLLSRQTVGVLPARSTTAHKGQETQEQKW